MTTHPRPPAHIAPYVEALGRDDAVRFFLAFGGAELSLPARALGRSAVARLVGLAGAQALSDVGDRLPRRVPTAKPWIAQVWRADGLAVSEIARRLHVTDVTVRSWLKRAAFVEDPPVPRQGRLL